MIYIAPFSINLRRDAKPLSRHSRVKVVNLMMFAMGIKSPNIY